MSLPTDAIVGRPNVGKSTLFNRLVGFRKAIVDPLAGLTRDRLYGVAEWRGRGLTVVDTAGLGPAEDATVAQTRVAIGEAQLVVVLLDGPGGLLPPDRDIAQMPRRRGRPVGVAAKQAA